MFLLVAETGISAAPTVDAGAGRLLEAVSSACDSETTFVARLQAGLTTTLAFFAAEPALARMLAFRPYTDTDALYARQVWLERFGALLRQIGAEEPSAAVNPPYVEPAILGGVAFSISRRLQSDGAEQLPGLLPEVFGYLLSFYFEPEQAWRIASESRGGLGERTPPS
jgi:hypothetical protein